ncbi:hypothetical protein PPERSA_10178 [Pseudocohnilembus persalinus]|uniref:Vacuolar protein sorting-associated protein 29 n=1 Tax=Pseudocohnilembus persalinus TaxID=266149 RepID=A0A0V0QL73_PSEPJ|nr:hypothetical protein PPERSA_10178 [Pseudocohnilembus persalinus]|eukprot:KRX03097.1 hypothetical protein PPERSA_10178 [Pseudocohnilembus persalinus]
MSQHEEEIAQQQKEEIENQQELEQQQQQQEDEGEEEEGEEEEEEEDFGELALVIGDFHIPTRAADIPEQFKELLQPGKVKYVFSTGNIGNKETLDWLKSLSQNFHTVKGDFEEEGSDFPEQKTVQVGNYKLGLIHGHQVIPWGDDEALLNEQRQMDCDVLISGHTHTQRISKIDKKYLINPGSVTGAYSPISKDNYPSFMLLVFGEKSIKIFSYKLIADNVEIDSTTLPFKQ